MGLVEPMIFYFIICKIDGKSIIVYYSDDTSIYYVQRT